MMQYCTNWIKPLIRNRFPLKKIIDLPINEDKMAKKITRKKLKKIYSVKLMVNPPKYSQHKQQPCAQLLKLLFLSPQIRLIETSVPLRLWCQTQSLLMTLTKLYQWLMCHHHTTEIGWFVVLFEQLMKG